MKKLLTKLMDHVYAWRMKTLITLLFVAALSACTIMPSELAMMDRITYIRSLNCSELRLKLQEYQALSDRIGDINYRSDLLVRDELATRCKK
jgi:hypothetical protein